MTRVVIQPAGGPASRQHFEDTVQKPVPQDRLRPFLSPEEITALESAYGRNPMPIWGLTPSGRRAGKDAWSQMHPGGYRVVHRGNRVYSGGIVTYRVHNAALARELWREDRKGRTWEYVYFLNDMFDLSIPYGSLNRVLGYKSNFVPQGILVLDPVKSQEMIDTFRLTTALPPEAEVDEATSTIAESAGEPSLRQGYRLSPELRRAIETHAVKMAIKDCEKRGWKAVDVSHKESYDLLCSRGKDEMRVEVKGTTSKGREVLLTPNEVSHARAAYPNVMLLVV